MSVYKTIVFAGYGQPFEKIEIDREGNVLRSWPEGSFRQKKIYNPDVTIGQKVQIDKPETGLVIHQPVITVIEHSTPSPHYFVFTQDQLDQALRGWFIENNPHAAERMQEIHPDVKAVRSFLSSRYVTQTRMARA